MGSLTTRKFLSYGAVYAFWGASFLAIRELVLVAPPLLTAGVRFSIAGLSLWLWTRAQRHPRPQWPEVRSTMMLGLTMFTVNYGCLFWAEQSVSSGYAAILSAIVPVWVFMGEWLWLGTVRPNARSILGMILGIAGVGLVVTPSSGSSQPVFPALALLVATLCWSAGTLWSRKLPMPSSRPVSAALQMGSGGFFLLLFSGLFGERRAVPAAIGQWTPRLTFAMAYLIVFASIAAFLAYVWLIDHEPASRVTSNCYVNPLVAVALGAAVAGERLALPQFAGAALVVIGVVFTLLARNVVAKGHPCLFTPPHPSANRISNNGKS